MVGQPFFDRLFLLLLITVCGYAHARDLNAVGYQTLTKLTKNNILRKPTKPALGITAVASCFQTNTPTNHKNAFK